MSKANFQKPTFLVPFPIFAFNIQEIVEQNRHKKTTGFGEVFLNPMKDKF